MRSIPDQLSFTDRIVLIAIGIIALASIPTLARPGRIVGLPPQAVEHMPGVMSLFEMRDASSPPKVIDGKDFRPGEIVARFQLELSDADVYDLAQRAGALDVVRKSPFGLFVLQGPPSDSAAVMDQFMRRVWESGQTVMISPNYLGDGGIVSPVIPNDPNFSAQWYLENGFDVDLDLSQAWDITEGSPSVVVAVMDTGIIKTHPEFQGRLWENPLEAAGQPGVDDDNNGYFDDINGWDSTSTSPGDPDVEDDDGGSGGGGIGHGTWVSSILLANSDNLRQIAGFDHSAKLLTVRSFNQGSGYTLSHILGGLDYLLATVEHYDVVNMSWIALSTEGDIEDDLDGLELEDVLVVAGSGNNGGSTEAWYPASHPIALTIGATTDTDTLASFSNTGPSMDFVAPGVGIYTASFSDPSGLNASNFDDGNNGNGTSFSTPMVTGIASLGFSIRPAMTKDDLVFALKESAVDLGTPGWDSQYGWGRVNAHDALVVLRDWLFSDGFESGDVSKWTSSSP